ncbi:hypothetical protein JW935_19280 [candidate division KSB1 bacterium]|nr:hypothetical protein [candidate division KSB1 bacterium]
MKDECAHNFCPSCGRKLKVDSEYTGRGVVTAGCIDGLICAGIGLGMALSQDESGNAYFKLTVLFCEFNVL